MGQAELRTIYDGVLSIRMCLHAVCSGVFHRWCLVLHEGAHTKPNLVNIVPDIDIITWLAFIYWNICCTIVSYQDMF